MHCVVPQLIYLKFAWVHYGLSEMVFLPSFQFFPLLFPFFVFQASVSVFRLVATAGTCFAPEQIGLLRTRLAPLCKPIWTLDIPMNGNCAFEHPLLEVAKKSKYPDCIIC